MASASPSSVNAGYTTAIDLAQRLNDLNGVCDRRTVFVLDCRSAMEYSNGHISGSMHVSLPTILLKRLQKGTLPVCSVVGGRDGRDLLNEYTDTASVVVVTDRDHSQITHPSSSSDSLNIASLLYKRFQESGVSVSLLKGMFFVYCMIHTPS